ncbi:MAG: hypothetical protein HQ522_07705 [Bacteroidetes bacterium]|nr:hypothetical protein [Bacteroidota bacterium]
MRKNIFFALAIFTVVSMFHSCTTPPIEAAQEAYDYNAIIPKIFAINGPSQTAASGLAPVTYSIPTKRGGSTTAWTVTGHGATVTPVEGDAFSVDVMFAQSDVDIDAVQVTCVETTMGGVSSDPKSISVDLKKFKPMTFAQFLGDWSYVETGSGESAGTITISDAGGGKLTLELVTDEVGLPPVMSWIFIGWGEAFQPGFADQGNIIIEPNLNSGGVTIPGQYWGQTLPGPYDYWIHGSGNWEGINQTMTLSYGMDWDDGYGDSYKPCTMVLTKL